MPWITAVVLQEDVENARRVKNVSDSERVHCPLERALCRALALPLGHVCATYDRIEVYQWKDHELVEGVPTKKMRLAMERFDRTGHMTAAPFRITLKPVP
jgi:hypothetical protein